MFKRRLWLLLCWLIASCYYCFPWITVLIRVVKRCFIMLMLDEQKPNIRCTFWILLLTQDQIASPAFLEAKKRQKKSSLTPVHWLEKGQLKWAWSSHPSIKSTLFHLPSLGRGKSLAPCDPIQPEKKYFLDMLNFRNHVIEMI